MQASKPKQKQSQSQSWSFLWSTFLKTSCDALFQTALLISADCAIAEASLFAAFEEINPCQAPRENELAILQSKVVTLTLLKLDATPSEKRGEPRLMLQSGLWPVLALERTARTSFVLHYLLGYSLYQCALLLKMDEAKTKDALQRAVLQLCDADEANEQFWVQGQCRFEVFQSGSTQKRS